MSFDLGKSKDEYHLVLKVCGQFVGSAGVKPDHHRGAAFLPIYCSLSRTLFSSVDCRDRLFRSSPILADLASVHLVVLVYHTLLLQRF